MRKPKPSDVGTGRKTISINTLIEYARQLASEHGENPEYDRALVELVSDCCGVGQDHYKTVADVLQVKKWGSNA